MTMADDHEKDLQKFLKNVDEISEYQKIINKLNSVLPRWSDWREMMSLS